MPRPTRWRRKTRRACARSGSPPSTGFAGNANTRSTAPIHGRVAGRLRQQLDPPGGRLHQRTDVRRLRADHLDRQLDRTPTGDRAEHRLTLKRLAGPQTRHARRHSDEGRPHLPLAGLGLTGTGAGDVQRHDRLQRLRQLHRSAGGQLRSHAERHRPGRPSMANLRTRKRPASAQGPEHPPAPVRLRGLDPGRIQIPQPARDVFKPAKARLGLRYRTRTVTGKLLVTGQNPRAQLHGESALPLFKSGTASGPEAAKATIRKSAPGIATYTFKSGEVATRR